MVPRRAGMFEMLEEMLGVRLGLTDAMLAKVPVLKQMLERITVLQQVAKDRVCLVNTELAALELGARGCGTRCAHGSRGRARSPLPRRGTACATEASRRAAWRSQ